MRRWVPAHLYRPLLHEICDSIPPISAYHDPNSSQPSKYWIKKVLPSLPLGKKTSIVFWRKAPTPWKGLGSAKLHFFWILKVAIIGGTENAIDLNFPTWWQCSKLIQGLDDWLETQDMKENTITGEERQLRDTARRKMLMTRSLDVTLSQVFVVLFSAMFGRYKQTFTHCVYSLLCKSLYLIHGFPEQMCTNTSPPLPHGFAPCTLPLYSTTQWYTAFSSSK